jgi:hypothetical protein
MLFRGFAHKACAVEKICGAKQKSGLKPPPLVVDSPILANFLLDSIEVFKQPNSMVLHKENKLWVLTDGGFEGSPYGYERAGLLKIDAETREFERSFWFAAGDHPLNLCINPSKDSIFYQ